MRFISERPYLISLMLIILVALWLFVPMTPEENSEDAAEAPKRQLQKVQVHHLSSQTTELELIFTGRTEPNKKALIASELDGLLVSYHAERGSRVAKGDSIAEISTGSLNAALAGAKAEQRSAAVEYKAQANLVKRGLNAQNAKATANAALQAANARVQQVETELEKAKVSAPFDGLIADHHAEVGDFMSVGKTVATLIDLDPIRAVGDVAERDISELTVGDSAKTVMLNGDEVSGEITYISPFADESTRTFRVEITLPNKDGALVAGMTTQVKVPLRSSDAYKISPALLTLSAEGDIQVAAVDNDDRVVLHDVDLIRSETDGIWVSGLPAEVRVITLGQGFVHDGDLVDPVEEGSQKAAAAEEKQ